MKSFLKIIGLVLLLLLVACSSGETDSSSTGTDSGNDNGDNNSDDKIVVKIGHVVAEDTAIHMKFVKFKEVLESESDGKFSVEIYPNSQLGDERELTESTQFGNIQVSSPDIGAVASIEPSLQVFNLPFLFKNSEDAHRVLDGDIGRELLDKLENHGFVGLGYAENGWRHLTTKDGPIRVPEDAKGLKLRTMEDPLHIAFWKQLGLNPTPLAFSEVYTALSQGVVDGQENPLALIVSSKFHEVTPFITLTGHIYAPELFLVNKDFFYSLSDEDQQLFFKAAEEAIAYQRQLNLEDESELRKTIEDEGGTITELTDEEKDQWIELVKPIYKEYVDEIGEETIIKVMEAANNTVGLSVLQE